MEIFPNTQGEQMEDNKSGYIICYLTPEWGWTIRLKTREERNHLAQNEISNLDDFDVFCPILF